MVRLCCSVIVWFNRTFSTSSVTRILLVCLATAFVGACQLSHLPVRSALLSLRLRGCHWQPAPLQRGSQESCGFQFRLSIKAKSPCLPRRRAAKRALCRRCRRATKSMAKGPRCNAAADEVEGAVSSQASWLSTTLPSAPSRSLIDATGAMFFSYIICSAGQ